MYDISTGAARDVPRHAVENDKMLMSLCAVPSYLCPATLQDINLGSQLGILSQEDTGESINQKPEGSEGCYMAHASQTWVQTQTLAQGRSSGLLLRQARLCSISHFAGISAKIIVSTGIPPSKLNLGTAPVG